MVQFDKKDGEPVFTASIRGDKKDYLDTIKTLLNIVGRASEDLLNENDRYNIGTLIEDMLPDERQIVSLEDAQYLEAIKRNNNNIASTIISH